MKILIEMLTALAHDAADVCTARRRHDSEAAVVQFPMTVGIWAIFVQLFVKLK